MLGNCIENVRKNVPLVHNITNYVTVNDVANVILACGGSPISFKAMVRLKIRLSGVES